LATTRWNSTSFGAQFGVHFNGADEDVNSAIATVNQDGSHVIFHSTDAFDTTTSGEAVVADGNGKSADPSTTSTLTFGRAGWDAVTFSFSGGDNSLMSCSSTA